MSEDVEDIRQELQEANATGDEEPSSSVYERYKTGTTEHFGRSRHRPKARRSCEQRRDWKH
jgi:hypothetical protein